MSLFKARDWWSTTHICIQTHTHTHIHIHIHTYTHTYNYTYTHTFMYTLTYMSFKNTHTHTRTHAHTHTHTHTHTPQVYINLFCLCVGSRDSHKARNKSGVPLSHHILLDIGHFAFLQVGPLLLQHTVLVELLYFPITFILYMFVRLHNVLKFRIEEPSIFATRRL